MVQAFERLGHIVEMEGLAVTSAKDNVSRPSAISRLRRALPRSAFELAQAATSGATFLPIRHRIAAFRPDFIYKRHAKYDFGPVLAARHSRVPVILEVNCVYSAPSLRKFEPVSFSSALAATERWIFDHVDRNIAVSTPLMRELLAVGPRARAVVMSNGVDHKRFVPDATLGAQVRQRLRIANEVVIGFVGTLWKWHGLDLLIDAFANVADSLKTRLLIVGDGEMRDALLRQCQARKVGDRVIFTGRVTHEEVAGFIAAMDITVLPAEHRSHACPMKVIEYMAAAKPVVGPDLPNLQEILTDGLDGLLFPPNDVRGFTECLERLSRNTALRQRLGAAARQKVEHELNWDSNARRVMALYEEIRRERAAG